MSRSLRLGLAASFYTAFTLGLFAALFDRRGSDDYAGWVPTVAALSLPACFVVAFARDRLRWPAALALGLPAAMSLGGVTLLMLWPVTRIYPQGDFTILLVLMLLGPVAVAVMAFIICRRLHGLPVRAGARRITTIVAASGALVLVVSSYYWWGFWTRDGGDLDAQVVFFLLGALPLGWSLGPALTLLVTTPDRD